MSVFVQALTIALALGGLLLWTVAVMPPLPRIGLDSLPEESLVATPLPASEDGRAVLSGIVVYDRQTDPPVAYIAYERSEGGMRTKQLVFRDRGCSPAAGDIPCATNTAAYPLIPERTDVRIAGVIYGDQIFVESIEGIY